MLQIDIDEELRIERLNHSHAKGIFNLINSNREYLRKWLKFVDSTRSIKDTENYIWHINKEAATPNSGDRNFHCLPGRSYWGFRT